MCTHYQICFVDNVLIETSSSLTTKRLNIKMFRKWVRHLINEGFDVKIEYDSRHHTYFALVKEVA